MRARKGYSQQWEQPPPEHHIPINTRARPKEARVFRQQTCGAPRLLQVPGRLAAPLGDLLPLEGAPRRPHPVLVLRQSRAQATCITICSMAAPQLCARRCARRVKDEPSSPLLPVRLAATAVGDPGPSWSTLGAYLGSSGSLGSPLRPSEGRKGATARHLQQTFKAS